VSNQKGMELIGTHQPLVCIDNVNMLGENTNTTRKNTETMLELSREVYLEVNVEETRYMFVSYHQKSIKNHNLLIANKSF
jgi:hypothetical protein